MLKLFKTDGAHALRTAPWVCACRRNAQAKGSIKMYKFDRAKYDERMKWFRHDRFGMFIH